MADILHSVAICTDDNRRIGIEEVYTLSPEGIQVNKPKVIEAIRKLGQEGKLVCDCGCGARLILKAGVNMRKRQHFAMAPGQNIVNCKATAETEYTRLCKLVMKCWLDNVFDLNDYEVQYSYSYSKIEDKERRFEFTHYISSRKFGLVFGKTEFIDPDKLSFFASKENVKFLAVAPEHEYHHIGQYPEYDMRMQNAQGYCVFLHANEDYSLSTLSVVRYEQSYTRAWRSLPVVFGKPLSHFTVSTDGELMYQGKLVMDLVAEKITAFKEYDADCELEAKRAAAEREAKKKENEIANKEFVDTLTAKKKERERREAERKAKTAERIAFANQKLREAEEAEKLKVQGLVENGERYLVDYPVKKVVYDIVKKAYRIEGTFNVLGRDGKYTQRRVIIMQNSVWFDATENNIVIMDNASDKKIYLIHLQHDAGERYKPSSLPSGGYCSFPFYARKNNAEHTFHFFLSLFQCSGGGTIAVEKVEYGCKLKSENQELMCYNYKQGVCGKPDSSCSYKELIK